MIGIILIVVAVAAVAAVLFVGILVMAVGGQTAAKWSNLLMRYRILAQLIALLVIAAVVYFAANR